MSPKYITGLSQQQEASIRNLMARMAPSAVPERLVFVPPKDYSRLRIQVENGRFGNSNVGSGAGSDERYGRSHSMMGDGFSLVGNGLTYLNADLLNRPNDLSSTLAHELGHYYAAMMGGNASEDTANRQRDLYLQRASQAQKIDSGVQSLPSNAQAVLSGAMRGIEAAPQPPQAILAGKQ